MSKIWNWLKDKWAKFEAWMATWAPGLKTKIVSALGAVGSAAVVLQNYVAGIPDNRFITETQIGVAGLVLFTLAFWLRGLSERASSSTETN